MKKIEIKRKIKYLVTIDGRNELTTFNKKVILDLIEKKLKNNEVYIVVTDLNKE